MPTIQVSSYDFPAALQIPGSAREHFSWDELIAAIVCVGKSSADQLTSPHRIMDCWREIVWRIALLDMAIGHDGHAWCKSDTYEELDPSEKVGVSYMLGLTATSALCTRFLHMPFLMHLDVYTRAELGAGRYLITSQWAVLARNALMSTTRTDSQLSQVFPGIYPAGGDAVLRDRLWAFAELLASKTRPDLFGLETHGGIATRYVVAEAKGRSGPLTAKDKEDCVVGMRNLAKLARPHGPAMLQSLTKDRVAVPGGAPVPVGRHLATFSHFSPNGAWCFSWKDPEEKSLSEQERTNAPPGRLIADFYANLLALGMVETARGLAAENENAEVNLAECPAKFIIPGTAFEVAMEFHPEVHACLSKAFSDRARPPHELLNDMPGILNDMEALGKIGPKTPFGINGVRIAHGG